MRRQEALQAMEGAGAMVVGREMLDQEAMAVLAVLQVVMAQAAVLAVGLRQQDRRKTLLLFPVVPMALAVAVLALIL